MAIRILDTLTLNNVEYHFTVPAWLQSFAISHIYGEYDYGDTNANYTIYASEPNTYPFSFRYSAGGFPSGNPSGSRVESGVAGTYFQFTSEYVPSGLVPILNNVQVMNWNTGGYYNYSVISWFFGIDDDTQQGYMWRFIAGYTRNVSPDNCAGKLLGIYPLTSAGDMYTFLKGLEPIVYEWECIDYLNTVQGRFRFTYIDSSILENSDSQQNIPRDKVLYLGTPIDEFLAGISNETVNILETKDGYRIVAKRDNTDGGYYLGFAVDNTVEWYDTITSLLAPYTTIGFVIDDNNEVGKFFKCYESSVGGSISYTVLYSPVSTVPTFEDIMSDMYEFLTAGIDNPEDIEDDPSDDSVDPWNDIPISGLDLPTKSAQDTGFVTLWEIGNLSLNSLALYMWSLSFLDYLNKFMNNPADVVVGLMIMPIVPDKDGSPSYINAGNVITDKTGYKLTNSFKKITLGTLKIKKQFKDFCDYSPYTKIIACLPYVGSHELNVSDVIGHTLTLIYMFDFFTGNCVAEIDVDDKPRYFFTGSAGYNIPTSSADYTRVYSGAISAGATIGTALCTYGASVGAGAEAALIGGMNDVAGDDKTEEETEGASSSVGIVAKTLNSVMSMKPNIEYTSGGGSSSAIMIDQSAYIVVESPIRKKDPMQDSFLGRTSLIGCKLGDVKGYTKCLKVHLDDVVCTGTERASIEKWLLNGVRFETGSSKPSYTPSEVGNFGLYLMNLKSDKDVIGKTWVDQILVEGKLLYDQSITSPKISVTGNYLNYTYAYIPLFDRFYYIDDIEVNKNEILTISMSVDVLQSFADQIKLCDALLDRQENLYSKNLDDRLWWSEQKTKVVTVPFLASNGAEAKFKRSDSSYILIMAGPGGTVPPEENGDN